MKLLDFKFLFVITFLLLFLVWFICSFFAISYEDGTNNSFIPKYSYEIAGLIMFSLSFWNKFLNTFFAFIFALFCSTLIVSSCIYLLINVKKTLNINS